MTAIRATDGAASGAILRELQVTTLPGDVPMSTRTGWWWLAHDGCKPVAFAGLTRSSKWSDAAYLCRAGVVASHRGKGLQRRLIAVRERKARALGLRWLITDTFDNPASGNSLIRAGFRLFSPSKPWAASGALYWRKRIT